ncbi:MAG: hypothetical protein V1916_03040 [Patescibacteria group bacterium]
MNRVIDAGHYYASVGPTVWSSIGWRIAEELRLPGDQLLLLIDDVHPAAALSPLERAAPLDPDYCPHPDLTILESAVEPEACQILHLLQQLPKKKGAKQNGNGQWFCSGAALTSVAGEPLCNLLDAGLTLRKYQLGFTHGLNVLPYYYAEQQQKLLHIISKVLPNFTMEVLLFDQNGNTCPLSI